MIVQGSIGMAKTPPYPYRVLRWYRYCRGITACIPLAYPFFVKKKNPIQVWYGSGTGWDKTKPKRCRFRVKLKPYLSSPPDSLLCNPILSLLYSWFSLSLTSSLHRWCTWFSLSHFLTLSVTGDRTEGAIVDLIVIFFYFFSHFGSNCSDCGMGLWYFC